MPVVVFILLATNDFTNQVNHNKMGTKWHNYRIRIGTRRQVEAKAGEDDDSSRQTRWKTLIHACKYTIPLISFI